MQQQVRFEGHAIEVRLYAEDPSDGFKPQTGRIAHWRPGGVRAHGIRVDDGIAEGGAITPHYDAMVAKLIAHGHDRDGARRQLIAALADAPLLGVRNNARFLRRLLASDAFARAEMTTPLLDEWSAAGHAVLQRAAPDDDAWLLAAAARALRDGIGWRPASVAAFDLTLQADDQARTVRVRLQDRGVQITRDGATHEVHLLSRDGRTWTLALDGVQRRVLIADDGDTLHLVLDGDAFAFAEASPWPKRDTSIDPRRARAPVAGTVAQVLVRAGDAVARGQPLLSVEAMKMELWLSAAAAGTVRAVHAAPQATVESGAVLVELDIEETSSP
jgi:geranyl-CoA carboxylase alpha subunit